MSLPPGQRYRDDFPRFGLTQFADRVIAPIEQWSIAVEGDLKPLVLNRATLAGVERVEQQSDFHCVTTWSSRGLRWGGWRFRDVYAELLAPVVTSSAGPPTYLTLRGHDGYRCLMLLQDALEPDVLLADQLNGAPLGSDHGAPVRLVTPKLYGFKNAKHLKQLDLTMDKPAYKPMTPLKFMDHLRGRVELEERGQLPARLLRLLYRPLIRGTVRKFRRALATAR